MTAISAYIGGIRKVFGEKKMWFFFYGVLFVFGLLMILPIHGMILEHLGYPLDIGRNLGKFDYTQVADLLNNHGEALGIIFYQAKWIFLFYLLVSVLLTSGVVTYFQFQKSNFSFSDFIKSALEYFWRFFRLTLYFLIFQLILIALAILIYKNYLGSFSPFEIEDDSRLISGFWMIVPVYLLLAFILQIVSDVAKIKIVQEEGHWINGSIISAFKSVFGNFFKIIFFFLLHLLLFFVIYHFYHLVKSWLSLESTLGFWLLIVLGQLFIFIRTGLRLVKYAGLCRLGRALRI